MKRLFLSALLLASVLLTAGCGGGGGTTRAARGVAHVTLHIALPDRFAARGTQGNSRAGGGTAGPVSRLIPSNAVSYTIGYKQIPIPGDPTSSVVNFVTPVTSLVVVGGPNNPSFDVTLSDLAAGISNTITVTLYDTLSGPPGTIANGSTTVNLAPNAAVDVSNPINITLQSTVTGIMTFALQGGGTTLVGTKTLTVTVPNSPGGIPITTINPANLTWTSSDTTKVQINTSPATGYTVSVQRLAPGAVTITVRYSEIINNNGVPGTAQINSGTLALN